MPIPALIPSALAAIAADARARYPQESCGLLLSDGGYLACPNVASDPRTAFVIPVDFWTAHAGQVAAVVHSHPDGPDHPTARDMAGQVATDVPWVLVATDGETVSAPIVWGGDPPPLLGRSFVHGVTDCYALIRDWYRLERGVTLPEFPRDAEWWFSGGDLYRQGFAVAGFAAVSLDDVRPGDVVLMQVRSPVPNHGGVLLDDGLLLHHLTGRLSRREPYGPWRRMVTHVLRHERGETAPC